VNDVAGLSKSVEARSRFALTRTERRIGRKTSPPSTLVTFAESASSPGTASSRQRGGTGFRADDGNGDRVRQGFFNHQRLPSGSTAVAQTPHRNQTDTVTRRSAGSQLSESLLERVGIIPTVRLRSSGIRLTGWLFKRRHMTKSTSFSAGDVISKSISRERTDHAWHAKPTTGSYV
jgi:hypothetical protein